VETLGAAAAEVEILLRAKMDELRQAKEAATTSGRVEALAEFRSLVQHLDEARGTENEATLCRRIKARLRLLVQRIWVKVQPVHKRCRHVHVLLCLQGGERRVLWCHCGIDSEVKPWQLSESDFRAGDVAD
jgi:hypothetical protein